MTGSSELDAAAYDEQWARLGDFLRYNPGARHRRRLVRKALRAAGFRDGMLLDVGCGLGEMAGFLAERLPHVSITGVDLSPLAIERCRQARPRQRWIVADVTTDELPHGFDAVVCSEVLEHLDEPAAAVENLGRATRPGGVVVVTVPHGRVFETERSFGHVGHPSMDDLDAWCAAAELTIEQRWCWGWPGYAALKRAANVKPEAAMSAFGSGEYSRAMQALNHAAYLATYASSLQSSPRGVQTVVVARKVGVDA
jgi:SAM-dependent methyltransferase